MRPFEGFVAAGVIAAVGLSGFVALQVSRMKLGPLSQVIQIDSGGDSPITVVGGSITFRAAGASAWTRLGNSEIFYIQNSVTTPIVLERFKPSSDNQPTSWTRVTGTWNMKFYPRPHGNGDTGCNLGPCYVEMCNNFDQNLKNCSATPGNVVTIQAFGVNAKFNDKDAPDDDKTRQGKRYENTGCEIKSGHHCEYLAKIEVTIANVLNTYTCPDGECHVHMGPR